MIAYYAHSEGSGHSRYASIFYQLFSGDLKIMSSTPANFTPETKILKLAKEDPDGTGIPMELTEPPTYLHYSPVGQHSIQRRSLQLLTALVNAHCNLCIVDVSVEVAALARASSIPYAYVKLPGLRNDNPHLQAFKASMFNLAYYPQEFEDSATPKWVKDKTLYLGYFSRFSMHNNLSGKSVNSIRSVLIIRGSGGGQHLLEALPDIAKRFEGLQIKALGDFHELESPVSGIEFLGFQSQIENYIEEADLIIASAGLNLTSEILCSNRLFCCIPETRPFREQEQTASVLYEHEMAYSLADLILLSNDDLTKRLKSFKPEISIEKLNLFIHWLQENSSKPEKLLRGLKGLKEQLQKIDGKYQEV